MGFNFRTELGKMTPKIAEGAKIYIFGVEKNWDYICKQYKYLVNTDLDEYIDGFITNGTNSQISTFHGKPVFALSDIDLNNAVILLSTASWPENQEILRQLLPYGLYEMNSVFQINWILNILMRYEYERLLQLKGKHKGERCFIIGNGPSLSADDLEKLMDETTFATNKIFLIFDKTQWRPTYYVCEEDVLIAEIQDEISAHIKCPAFFARDAIPKLDKFKLTNFFFYYLDHRCEWRPNRKPTFSEEISAIQWGATVTYTCLQLAAYMGFGEIYLLGMDNTAPNGVKLNGEFVFNDASQSHFSNNYRTKNIYHSQIDVINLSYMTAREYAESHNIRIINATRGGKLEIFERVNLDDLF